MFRFVRQDFALQVELLFCMYKIIRVMLRSALVHFPGKAGRVCCTERARDACTDHRGMHRFAPCACKIERNRFSHSFDVLFMLWGEGMHIISTRVLDILCLTVCVCIIFLYLPAMRINFGHSFVLLLFLGKGRTPLPSH